LLRCGQPAFPDSLENKGFRVCELSVAVSTVIGMEILGARPVWSMSDSEKLSSLDATYAEIARLETLKLHLIAGLETTGYATEVGAGTTARLLTFRYRIDAAKARQDVDLATTLPKYPAVAAALPNPDPNALADTGTALATGENGEVDDGDVADGTADDSASDGGVGERAAGLGVLLHPAQAEAIVSALEKVPTTVPADDLRVAEHELVELARTHGPRQLRDAGKQFRYRLDTDGPEPDEHKAYDRESLKLKNADNGVAFSGYLANENAELFRTLIHTHAKPHKTIDGALDPRPRDKRQADALTTVLTAANNPTTTATATTGTAAPSRTDAPARTADAGDTSGASDARHGTSAADTTDPADTAGAGTTSTGTTSAGTTGAGTTGTGSAGASNAGPTVDDLADSLPGMPTNTAPAPTSTTSPGHGTAGHGTAGHGTADGPSHDMVDATTDARRHHGGGFIPGHGPKAHITVTIDFNDLKAATADKIGHLIYGDGLSAATIRRLACDAQILPIVLGSDSQPLDVGTTVRLATGPMRKALIARDKGCVCCGAPPIYCDAHHVVSWIDGGATKLTNLALLCKRCHRDLHAGHWDIQITNGVVHVSRPTWAIPAPVPHGRYRPPTTTPHPPMPESTTAGTPTRAWPRDTDPPWITSDDTKRINPWGDPPDQRPTRAKTSPARVGVDPWADGLSPTATASHGNAQAQNNTTVPDPWGDAAQASDSVSRTPRTGNGSKLGSDNSNTPALSDAAAPEPDNRANPGGTGPTHSPGTADPGGTGPTHSPGTADPGGTGPTHSPGTADPCDDPVQPPGKTIAA